MKNSRRRDLKQPQSGVVKSNASELFFGPHTNPITEEFKELALKKLLSNKEDECLDEDLVREFYKNDYYLKNLLKKRISSSNQPQASSNEIL